MNNVTILCQNYYNNIKNLYNEEKHCQNKEGTANITVSFGDVSTKCIITTTVGEITFKLEGITYNAKAGMTWEQWAESDYNTSSIIPLSTTSATHSTTIKTGDDFYYAYTIIPKNGCTCPEEDECVDSFPDCSTWKNVKDDELIKSGGEYTKVYYEW